MAICSICGVNELITPEEIETGVCNECTSTLVHDVFRDDSQLFNNT